MTQETIILPAPLEATLHVPPPLPPPRRFRDWCKEWGSPPVILTMLGMLTIVGAWCGERLIDQSQTHVRIERLETRADHADSLMSDMQRQTSQQINTLAQQVNGLAMTLAGIAPQLNGMMELIKTLKDNEDRTDTRIIEAGRIRDDNARRANEELSRRLDTLSSQVQGIGRR